MLKGTIIGYTKFNGHPYSFGCIVNGFSQSIKIKDYSVIENYLAENIRFGNGISDFKIDSVYCENELISKDIANKIKAVNVEDLSTLMHDKDRLFLLLLDYSTQRTSLLKHLIENGNFVYVDKPLARSVKELSLYQNFIESGKLMSCSMFIFNKDFKKTFFRQNLEIIEISYAGNFENYFCHIIDPITHFLESKITVKKIDKKAVLVKDGKLKFKLIIKNNAEYGFNYVFRYQNSAFEIIDIKSNFQSFRTGLINLKHHMNNKIHFRSYEKYENTLKIYGALN